MLYHLNSLEATRWSYGAQIAEGTWDTGEGLGCAIDCECDFRIVLFQEKLLPSSQ